jgi:hypothetical protein
MPARIQVVVFLNSTQVKKPTAMENFSLLVLHAILWRRKMRVHPVNVKRLEFGMFSHLWPDLLEMFR